MSQISLPRLRLALLALVIAVFARCVTFEFVLFDDNVHLYDNPYLETVTPQTVTHFWTAPYFGMYIPLTYTAWTAATWASRLGRPVGPRPFYQPSLYHALNLFFHSANTLLVFELFLFVGALPIGAFLGAAFFATHPLQVESVAWISGFKDLFFVFFSLVCLNIHLRRRSGVLGSLFFVMAVLSKPTAVILPFVALTIEMGFLKRQWRDSFMAALPWLLIALPVIVLTKSLQPDVIDAYVPPLALRPILAGDALAFYLIKLVFPLYLTLDYGRDIQRLIGSGISHMTWMLPGLVVIVLATLRSRFVNFIALLFLVSLLPVLGFLPFRFQHFSNVGDRYVYFALMAPALGIALSFSRAKHWLRVGLVTVLVFFSVRSTQQSEVWRNSDRLFRHMLAVNPNSLIAHNNYANYLEQAKQLELALAHYKKALEIRPEWLDARYNIAAVASKLKRFEEAKVQLDYILSKKPDHADALFVRGVVDADEGNLDLAEKRIRAAISLSPQAGRYWAKLGTLYTIREEYEEAARIFERSLRLDPRLPDTYNNYGVARLRQKRWREAIVLFRSALELAPDYLEARENLAISQAAHTQKRQSKG